MLTGCKHGEEHLSTTENKQLLIEAFGAWAAGDMRSLIEAMTDDVTWIVSGHNSWAGAFRGKDAVRRELLAPLGAQFANTYTSTPSRFIAISQQTADGISKIRSSSTGEMSHADSASSASSWPGPHPA